MLAGEVHRHQVQIDALVAEVAKYSKKMTALDAAIAIADSRVNAAALGRIKAHRSDYGGRGGLTKFILAEVRAAGSVGLSTENVARLAAKRFDVLRFGTIDRKLYRDTVRTRLRWLQEQGDIESALAIWEGKKVRVWRKRESFDSFSELLNQRIAIEGARHG
ncbi:hypothetical protein [Rhodoferax mekongensis]|uniref:Regulatory protein RecX n=1 Tax=Rhodoferax mekongensis TaxID=3068341 RepID=A0ABZ0AWE7_9BURK|nr:hypothetical protein [Rhodoferax sp. TBRC 17307]WNO03975.1 hypothetical protein RAN89_13790 [Rhodoferax sp. TBRC 17307]